MTHMELLPPPDAQRIAEVVEKSKSKAEDYVKDPEKAHALVDQAARKAKSQEANKGPLADVWNYLTGAVRLFKAYIRHEYVDIPWGSVVLVVVAIVYFVSPLDMVIDWIPVLGFVDDAAVIAFVIGQVKKDLDKFFLWEGQAGPSDKVIDG